MHRWILSLPLLAACMPGPVPPPPGDLPMVRPYRAEGDPCMLVGESAYTVALLDDTADLVGCPEGYDGLSAFATETGGTEVARHQGYVLFSVPRR